MELVRDDDVTAMEEEQLVLLSLACGTAGTSSSLHLHEQHGEMPRRRLRRRPAREDGAAAFECRTCGRRFASFQALGGHRTSHLRPARKTPRRRMVKPVVHACGVCGLGFSMGQALGGHMRMHRASKAGLKRTSLQETRPKPSSTLQLLDLFL